MRCLLGVMLAIALPAQGATWDFTVTLDGSPVGTHRFDVVEEGGGRRVTSVARFDFTLLGISVYRYRHEAVELWRGDCMVRLDSHTDDNGERSAVALAFPVCVMSFAYWNPAILGQAELLNSQTGQPHKVSTADLGREPLAVRGRPLLAQRYRISGARNPIDLWYSEAGEWLALESRIAGGRQLRYEIQ